jgi:hypothetical protein
MSGDSTPAGHSGTTSVGKILASAITTKSKGPLTGTIELRTEGGHLEPGIDDDFRVRSQGTPSKSTPGPVGTR